MELQDLNKIGLTAGEIKIYDALLELGETTRTKLAKTSGISPSKIYDVANRLIEKGIISSVKKNGTIHFRAADPERLHDFLQQKEEELRKERAVVDALMPQLLAKYEEAKSQTSVEVFYGWEGMKTVYNDIAKALEPGDVNYIFGASMGKNWKQADRFFEQYARKIRKKGYGIHIIFNENVRGHKDRIENFEGKPHAVKYLHQDTFAEINLYHNVVHFVMLLDIPMVIRVTNKETADAFKKFFDTMWELAKP